MTSNHNSLSSISLAPTLQFASGSNTPPHRPSVSSPSPYSCPSPTPRQFPLEPPAEPNSQIHNRDNRVSILGSPVYTIHTYGLKEYAYVFINSHADSPKDTPVIYRGEETTGTVRLPQCRLREVESINAVLRVFDFDLTNPTYKTKVVLSSGQIDPSHIMNDEFCVPFAIAPPTTTALNINLKFELQITIRRRGCLNRKIKMKQWITYSTRLDPPNLSPLPQTPARSPRNLPSSWKANNYPGVIVRGVIFQQCQVEVECKLIIPTSYPVCDKVPLRLVMTCVNRGALDLFAVSDVINVRLLQVLAFGKKAATTSPPFTLKNRESYHITKWVAKAHWYADGEDKELPADNENQGCRWRTELNGEFCREPCAEISHSFAEPGMAVMYYVCLFPFRAPDFQPTSNPNRILFYGQISLSQ